MQLDPSCQCQEFSRHNPSPTVLSLNKKKKNHPSLCIGKHFTHPACLPFPPCVCVCSSVRLCFPSKNTSSVPERETAASSTAVFTCLEGLASSHNSLDTFARCHCELMAGGIFAAQLSQPGGGSTGMSRLGGRQFWQRESEPALP